MPFVGPIIHADTLAKLPNMINNATIGMKKERLNLFKKIENACKIPDNC